MPFISTCPTCHLETGIAGHPPSRWHIVFQNSSDLLNRAADFPDPAAGRSNLAWSLPAYRAMAIVHDALQGRHHVASLACLVFNSVGYEKRRRHPMALFAATSLPCKQGYVHVLEVFPTGSRWVLSDDLLGTARRSVGC
jgi:hypothetical protein